MRPLSKKRGLLPGSTPPHRAAGRRSRPPGSQRAARSPCAALRRASGRRATARRVDLADLAGWRGRREGRVELAAGGGRPRAEGESEELDGERAPFCRGRRRGGAGQQGRPASGGAALERLATSRGRRRGAGTEVGGRREREDGRRRGRETRKRTHVGHLPGNLEAAGAHTHAREGIRAHRGDEGEDGDDVQGQLERTPGARATGEKERTHRRWS